MQRHHAPFRADVVGSFLRPDAIKQARLKFASGEIDAGQLRAVEDEAIRHVVEQQCACGLHVVTDGEFRRAWWHFDFFDGLRALSVTIRSRASSLTACKPKPTACASPASWALASIRCWKTFAI
jgi:Methionine synthase II (cobalamin-independent)